MTHFWLFGGIVGWYGVIKMERVNKIRKICEI